MTLQVVGSGLGRTGTMSLKAVLERLLGGTCHHMLEVFGQLEKVPTWTAAAKGEQIDWNDLMDGFVASVDWPSSAYWQELAAANPDALILHSERDSADTWFTSANNTIFPSMQSTGDEHAEWSEMIQALMANRFTADYLDEASAKAAYERHNANVRENAPKDRLLIWKPGDGWEPICERLGVAVPDEPFPHSNSSAEFRERAGLDD